jgi:hypothetical protein
MEGFQCFGLEIDPFEVFVQVVHVGIGVVPEGPVPVHPEKSLRLPEEHVPGPGRISGERVLFQFNEAVHDKMIGQNRYASQEEEHGENDDDERSLPDGHGTTPFSQVTNRFFEI